MIRLSFLIFSLFWRPGASLYGPSSPVSVLDGSQFTARVKNTNDPHIVEFYSSGCGHCRNFVPEYEKAAKALKGIIKVVAVEDSSVMQAEGIRGFPTVKFFSGSTVRDFQDARTAQSLIDFSTRQLNSLAKSRLTGGSSSSSSSSGNKSKEKSEVIALTDDNFEDEVVVKSNDDAVWFVEFYAPWCGHCKSLAPTWEDVARTLKGKVKVAKVDATKESLLARHFSVQGFPMLYLIPPHMDSSKKRTFVELPRKAILYDGARDAGEMVRFALQFAGKTAKAEQLVSNSQFTESCSKGVCLIAFLPHILDTQASGRQAYLETLNAVVRSSFTMPVKFFWSQGGDQFEFEEKLRLQFGWPAVVAVNIEKEKYAIHKGGFVEDALRQFITGLMSGRQVVDPLPKPLPQLGKATLWDGKDAPLEVESSEDEPNEEL